MRIIASYPKDKDPLLSGWLLGADRIKGKAALVEVDVREGSHDSFRLPAAVSRAVDGNISTFL